MKRGLGAIREEAGQPPDREVSRSEPPGDEAPGKGRDESKDFWFLDGSDADGWENTNATPDGDEDRG